MAFKKIIYTTEQQDLIKSTHEKTGNYTETARILNELGFIINKVQVRRFLNMNADLCPCGKPLLPNRLSCQACLNKANKAHTKTRKERKEKGVCVQCGKELSITSKTYCPICQEQNRKNSFDLRKKRKSLGLCGWCAQPVGPSSSVWCEKHYEAQRSLNLAWRHGKQALPSLERDNWKCVACGSGTDGKYRLETHHIDSNKDNNTLDNLVTLCHPCHIAITNLLVSPDPVGVFNFFKVHYLKA